MQIRCPACQWKPPATFHWVCSGRKCGHSWHTFATGGVCPACSRIWADTYCYECRTMQPHVDWYDDDGLVQVSADDRIDSELALLDGLSGRNDSPSGEAAEDDT